MKVVIQDKMIVYVTQTDGESIQTRWKNIEESKNVIDIISRFLKVEVIGYELYETFLYLVF